MSIALKETLSFRLNWNCHPYANVTNVSLPADFDKILATMRSREISVSIILQNMAQLKALFEKEWESIVGNCDEFLYLGGNEQSTHEYISKRLGKETIDEDSYSQSKGRSGSYTTSRRTTGRELMTPDEVARMDNGDAILFIRGEYPVRDRKYNIMNHPNISLLTDGGAEPYRYGEDELSWAALRFDENKLKNSEEQPVGEEHYICLCEEELEDKIRKKLEEGKKESSETAETGKEKKYE